MLKVSQTSLLSPHITCYRENQIEFKYVSSTCPNALVPYAYNLKSGKQGWCVWLYFVGVPLRNNTSSCFLHDHLQIWFVWKV